MRPKVTVEERFARQVEFLIETEKLKAVLRRTAPVGIDRRENSAEHSWSLALMAVLFAEYSNEPLDVGRLVRMVLVHDLVEIDAGDTFCYDTAGNVTKVDRERQAAGRIFGLLPAEQAGEWRALWDEFEAGATAEAKFANAIDRFLPVLQNTRCDGDSWRTHGITFEQVIARNRPIGDGATVLWEHARRLIEDCRNQGFLK